MKFQSIRGMNDIGGEEIHLWHFIENTAKSLYHSFAFQEVRTPVLEPTALFKRGVGGSTDIVEKEMYSFVDRNGDELSLRPEGTASVARAVLQHSWLNDQPTLKLYYFAPMFRHERPQKGRYRQHYQFGLEIFGVEEPSADVEIISIQAALFQKLGLSDGIELRLSSIGCKVCRPPYKQLLQQAIAPVVGELCSDCQRRQHTNPLRIFDCKVERCQQLSQNFPKQFDHLCTECSEHFKGVINGLDNLGITYVVDPKIVRGLDYYNRTSFEFVSSHIGAQGTVCGGGRYDGLLEDLGGKSAPGVGCGMGVERIVLLMEEQKKSLRQPIDIALIFADAESENVVRKLAYDLRLKGYSVELALGSKSLKAQMKRADKVQAQFAVIIGQREVEQQKVVLKNMASFAQTDVPIQDLGQELGRLLNPV